MILIVISAACLFEDVASFSGYWGVNIRLVAAVGDGEYIGGGAFKGIIKAFILR